LRPTTGLLALVLVALVAGYLLGSGGDDSTPPTGGGQAPTRSAAAAQPAMNDTTFWHLIADTREETGGDTEPQSELLEEKLSRLPAEQIAEFQRIRHRLDEQAYSWDLWGAAYVIEDGCSDDCFRDFRSYLISLGREPYEAALRDPDSLAPVVEDAETGDWENADSVAGDAYESAVGEDIPADDSDLSGEPSGEPWDDEDQDALVQRYPQLAERFR
jgi:Protein of unknown function (DUF4240)